MKADSESKQMYIKAIYMLNLRGIKSVRKIDIANAIGRSRPSVTVAIRRLAEDGDVMVKNGAVELTRSGQIKAKALHEKNVVLTELFRSLGAEQRVSEENACRMEHVISDELFNIVKRYLRR